MIGLILTFAGWQGAYRPFHIDDIGNRENARALVERGDLPVTSGLSALNTYTAAGGSWYYVPSTFFEDVGFGERFNAFLLYLLTIIPLFLLCRRIADRTTALVVVLLYTVSAVGIYFEHNLWYRARPFAYAWLALFALRWVETGAGRFLLATVIALGFGLLINLEMIPIVFGLALVVWRFQPRFDGRALAAAVVVVVIAWGPYLSFQLERDFVDLRSALTLQNLGPDPIDVLQSYGEQIGTWSPEKQIVGVFAPTDVQRPQDRGFAKTLLIRAMWTGRALTANFRLHHPFGLAPLGLALLFGLIVVTHLRAVSGNTGPPRNLGGYKAAGVAAILLAAVFNQMTISYVIGRILEGSELTNLWTLQTVLVLLGLGLATIRHVTEYFSKIGRQFKSKGVAKQFPTGISVLAAIVLPTWFLFAVLSRLERYILGFWVLQLALVATCLVYLPRHYELSQRVRIVGIVLAFALVLPNGELADIGQTWTQHGYAGTRHDLLRAAEQVVELSNRQQIDEPRIGYLLFFGNPYHLIWGHIDPRYGGVGSAVHQYVNLQLGAEAVRPPAEGFSVDDEFRIVELVPRSNDLPHRFVMTDSARFQAVGRFGTYRVLSRRTDIHND